MEMEFARAICPVETTLMGLNIGEVDGIITPIETGYQPLPQADVLVVTDSTFEADEENANWQHEVKFVFAPGTFKTMAEIERLGIGTHLIFINPTNYTSKYVVENLKAFYKV